MPKQGSDCGTEERCLSREAIAEQRTEERCLGREAIAEPEERCQS